MFIDVIAPSAIFCFVTASATIFPPVIALLSIFDVSTASSSILAAVTFVKKPRASISDFFKGVSHS